IEQLLQSHGRRTGSGVKSCARRTRQHIAQRSRRPERHDPPPADGTSEAVAHSVLETQLLYASVRANEIEHRLALRPGEWSETDARQHDEWIVRGLCKGQVVGPPILTHGFVREEGLAEPNAIPIAEF